MGLNQGDNSFVINKESGVGNARRDCYVPESRHVVGISARERQYRGSVTPTKAGKKRKAVVPFWNLALKLDMLSLGSFNDEIERKS
jgi:hypothetical protein